jgi:hypothetical protein
MLEFASQLFIRMVPNNRAFAATIEAVLAANGFSFQTQDSLWCRFSNALLHYQILVQEVDAEVQRLARVSLQLANADATCPAGKDADPAVSISDDVTDNDNVLGALKLNETTPLEAWKYLNARHTTSIPTDTPSAHPSCLPPSSETPSEYLRSRCPLCFGGTNTVSPELLAQCIVCLDANFQLKRKFDRDMRDGRDGQRGSRDPQYLSPHSIILEQVFVEYWRDITEKDRPPKPTRPQAPQPSRVKN